MSGQNLEGLELEELAGRLLENIRQEQIVTRFDGICLSPIQDQRGRQKVYGQCLGCEFQQRSLAYLDQAEQAILQGSR